MPNGGHSQESQYTGTEGTEMITNVFISYRRDGGEHLAARVRSALQVRGFTVFMDVEDLKSGKFTTALLRKIEEATDFVVILTPGSLDRCMDDGDWLRKEVAHAIKCTKNVVPVIARGFQMPSASALPSDISDLPDYNGLTPTHELFEESMDRLASTLLQSKRNAPSSSGLENLFVAVGERFAHLQKHCASDNWKHRQSAIKQLPKAGPKAIPILGLLLRTDPDQDVRIASAESLGQYHTDEALPPLFDGLKDGSTMVRIAAAEAIGALGFSSAKTALQDALEIESDYFPKPAMINALAAVGDSASVPLLEQFLNDERRGPKGEGRICDVAWHGIEMITARLANEVPNKRIERDSGKAAADGGPTGAVHPWRWLHRERSLRTRRRVLISYQ